jgi:hypothetical protein
MRGPALSRQAGFRAFRAWWTVDREDGRPNIIPPSGRLQCVILARQGFITIDAAAWLAREHVATLIIHQGEFLTLASAAAGKLARGELAARRKQLECCLNPKRRLNAAKWLVAAKIKTLGLPAEITEKSLGKAAKARTIEDAMV